MTHPYYSIGAPAGVLPPEVHDHRTLGGRPVYPTHPVAPPTTPPVHPVVPPVRAPVTTPPVTAPMPVPAPIVPVHPVIPHPPSPAEPPASHHRHHDYAYVEGYGWWPSWFPYWEPYWYQYWNDLYWYYGGDANPEYAEYARDYVLRMTIGPQWGWL